jgi:heat shock protein HslJ
MFCSAGEERLGPFAVVGGAAAGNRLQCTHAGYAAKRSSPPRRHVLAVSQISGSDDKVLTPDDSAKYTIAFGTDGSVSARVDCNRGRGTWKSSGPNQLQFGPLALTRAACPPGSLHDRIVKDWEFVRSYTLKNGHLFLALMADGGIYEFEPIGGSK